MAKHVLYDVALTVNSVDLADHAESVNFTVTLNGQAAAAMSEVEDYEMPGTRKVSDIAATMYQDFAASKTYATLMTLWTNRTTFNLVMKPTSSSAAATNPQFTVPVFIRTFPVISGNRGDRHMSQVVFAPAGLMTISAP
jgi:hypothetical protein